MLPGYKSLLSLPLSVVPLLLVVIIIFEAAVFSRRVPLLGPVVVAVVVGVVVTLPGSGSGPGPAAAGASYADPPDVSRLSEPAVPLLMFLLPVAGLREFGPEAVRRQAPFAAAAAVAAAGASPGSPGPRTAGLPAAVRAGAVRHRHMY